MQSGENIKRVGNNAEIKLEEFKKTAFEVIEYKDKIIKMLCAILEVQGITTVNINEFISNSCNLYKDHPLEHIEYGLKTHKKKLCSRKRAILDMQNHRTVKRNKELNIFSTPNKINEQDIPSDTAVIKNKNEDAQQDHQPTQQHIKKRLKEAMNGNMLSARKHNSSFSKNFIESRKRAIENLKIKDENSVNNYKSDSHVELCSTKKKQRDGASKNGECQLCLMPISESLHGSFPPLLFTLRCNHVFHLMCLYETIIRRECRKTCCICHTELVTDDKNSILNKVKLEKKENDKKSKMLLKVMQMQATKL